ncbi:Gfo/Idh/MocA family protein [Alicyclobacillus shizuokensis]|uniref:Gfo/Idh/MocA family protein n=1 Tax=Alicyclobacillus shizuokensis TaxID=392014 RepID=UPI000833A58B|nr:Gfo/Idh/MocA family oxidoreductase [Alicyclobacillus shizuokensis]MCL6625266.1 Gfo/Idh/MocA family oxidoreductase [Alicyclobacillus shizuokensis]
MKVAIFSFAHMHAYSYAAILSRRKDIELAFVADENEERGSSAAEKYGARFVPDYQAVLNQPDVEAVVICSENARHAEMVVAAAEAGKHVLCEKPIATSMEDGRRMVAACNEASVKFQIAFPIRFSTPVQRVKHQVDQGKLGQLMAINGTNRGQNPGGWFVDPALSGGGAVLDHTVHVIDIMRWYTGSEVREVYAEVGTRFSARSVDDCGLLTMSFENGVIAAHDPSWSRPKTFPTWGDVTLRLIGTAGALTVDALAQNLVRYDDEAGTVKHIMWGDDPDEQMLNSFIESIYNDAAPLVTGEDGLKATEVALAAYESARTGRPVKLPLS